MDNATDTRPIPGFRDYYATAHGQIISRKRAYPRTLKPWFDGRYWSVGLQVDRAAHNEYVHRLVLLAFVGPAPTPGHICRHLNGKSNDNRVENLAWGTMSDSAKDAVAHGTSAAIRLGDRHNAAKLKAEQVVEIAQWLNNGDSYTTIAKAYDTSIATVCHIAKGKRWAHVAGPILNPLTAAAA